MDRKNNSFARMWNLIGLRYKSHPWHGIEIGENAPEQLICFIEMTPTDTVKYEVDKVSGYLRVDRPQRFSNHVPALYGFVPKTYCGDEVAAFCNEKTGRDNIVGDDDPLDVCVLTERHITHGDLLVEAIPIGGFRMIDGGEADDKIIAVLKGDEVIQGWSTIEECPPMLINRLRHYFLTYKQIPGEDATKTEISHIYGRAEAHEVIRRSMRDYQSKFGKLENKLSKAMLRAVDFGLSWQEALGEEEED